MTAGQGSPEDVLVLTAESGMFLVSRRTFAEVTVGEVAGLDEGDLAGALRVAGVLAPGYPVIKLGVRTLGGLPAPVMAAPGILDSGEAQVAVGDDGTLALFSLEMLEHVRVRPGDYEAVRAAMQ